MAIRSSLTTHRTLTRGGVLSLALCGLALGQPGSITTFDAPGAGTGFRQGTTATGINAAGFITGYYVDGDNLYHGFVRNPEGTFAVFDASTGAGTATLSYGINNAGAVTGYYIDDEGLGHGFMRSSLGAITTFDAPPASSTSGTYAYSINDAGAIAGFYLQSGISYSFVRDPSGAFTTFGVPGAGGSGLNGTRANSINNANVVAGSYSYNSINYTVPDHGFLRHASGSIATFHAPAAGSAPGQGTQPYAINDGGAITGSYIDAQGEIHGFVRAREGTIIVVDAPGATDPSTVPVSINDSGVITGSYSAVAAGLSHGFVRTPSGAFTTFDAPGAGGAAYSGTFGTSINAAGAVTGYFIDANSTSHGFLRTP